MGKEKKQTVGKRYRTRSAGQLNGPLRRMLNHRKPKTRVAALKLVNDRMAQHVSPDYAKALRQMTRRWWKDTHGNSNCRKARHGGRPGRRSVSGKNKRIPITESELLKLKKIRNGLATLKHPVTLRGLANLNIFAEVQDVGGAEHALEVEALFVKLVD